MKSYVYNCNEKNYGDLVCQIEKESSYDLERLDIAQDLMNPQQYHHYLIDTLQKKIFENTHINGIDSTISFKLSDIDDFLKATLWLNEHIEREIHFKYVEANRKSFIETLIKNLY